MQFMLRGHILARERTMVGCIVFVRQMKEKCKIDRVLFMKNKNKGGIFHEQEEGDDRSQGLYTY